MTYLGPNYAKLKGFYASLAKTGSSAMCDHPVARFGQTRAEPQ